MRWVGRREMARYLRILINDKSEANVTQKAIEDAYPNEKKLYGAWFNAKADGSNIGWVIQKLIAHGVKFKSLPKSEDSHVDHYYTPRNTRNIFLTSSDAIMSALEEKEDKGQE